MMTRTLQAYLLAVICLTSLSGCLRGPVIWQRVVLNQPLSEQDVSFIVDGATNLLEVVEKLGAPDKMVEAGEAIVTQYHFSNGKYLRVDYGWGLRFLIPFYSPELVLGGGGMGTDVFQVTYNKEWVVRDHAFAFHSQSSEFRPLPIKD
jgi:hypothetical protein